MKITFTHSTVGTSGVPYKAQLASFEYPDQMSDELAKADACQKFELMAGVSHWQHAADRIEIERS